MNTFGAYTADDVTDFGQENVEQKWRDGEWNTVLEQAPRGEDVLVAMRTYSSKGECSTQIGMLIWEPCEKEPDETDADIEGYFGEHDGQMGIWYWHCGEDGYTDKKYLAAWRPMPPSFFVEPMSASQ